MNATREDVEREAHRRDLEGPPRTPALSPVVRHAGTAGRFRPDCAHCPVRTMCLPSGLRPTELRLLDFVVISRHAVHRGHTLYRAGDSCDAVYPIRAGFFKTAVVSRGGDEQVTGLRMAGEVLGLDGFSTRRHGCDAVALDHSEVCVVPYANLLQQSLHEQALQRTFYNLLGREIERGRDLLLLLGGMWGIQRVAMFLLDVSQRIKAHGYSAVEFELRLTRREIGSYLGMELETVSRIVSRLERERLIVADRGHITIVDRDGLAQIAAGAAEAIPEAATARSQTTSSISTLPYPAGARPPPGVCNRSAEPSRGVCDQRV